MFMPMFIIQQLKRSNRILVACSPGTTHRPVWSRHHQCSCSTGCKGFWLEQLSHPPYSPGMAPTDFELFRQVKKLLHDDNEIKQAYRPRAIRLFYLTGIIRISILSATVPKIQVGLFSIFCGQYNAVYGCRTSVLVSIAWRQLLLSHRYHKPEVCSWNVEPIC